MHGDVKQLVEGHKKIPSHPKFDPVDVGSLSHSVASYFELGIMQVEAPSSQKNLMALLSAAAVALHKEVRTHCSG